jgi:hypothetical protein
VKNKLLAKATSTDIEGRVEKILRGLDFPDPPLDLDEVRALLKLDRQYYSTSDIGFMSETLSHLRIASKQVIARPTLILDAVKKWDLRAFYLPDRKRILIDKATPTPKLRWTEGHEIIHGILPWHAELMLGDTEQTLNPACHDDLEAEANYGAGQLLFLRDNFAVVARDLPVALASVQGLAKDFGNTLTSTLWRFVESVERDRMTFAVVTVHPHPRLRPANFDPAAPCRYFIRSPAFAGRFSNLTERAVFGFVASYCAPRRGGPLGQTEQAIFDDNGDGHLFEMETFFNRHDALTLAAYLRPVAAMTVVRLPAA